MHRKTISILIIPESKSQPFSLRINPFVFKFLGVMLLLVLLAVAVFVARYSKITASVVRVEKLKSELVAMNKLRDTLDLINNEILKINNYSKKIEKLTTDIYSKGGTGLEIDKPEMNNALQLADTPNVDSFTDSDLEEFVNSIKLKRNRDFLSIKDPKDKHVMMLKALPNILPIDGWISRGFNETSEYGDRPHRGLDIAASMNTPIKSTAPGVVTFAGWEKDLGHLVIIDHGHGFITRYGHCSRLLVKKGDIVRRNGTVALLGNSGRSTAPHLHYEVIHKGVPIDPLIFIVE